MSGIKRRPSHWAARQPATTVVYEIVFDRKMRRIAPIASALLILLGCRDPITVGSRRGNATISPDAKNAQTVQTDLQQLAKHINVPKSATAVRYEMNTQPGGNDHSITAAIWLSPTEAARIVETSPRLPGKARISRNRFVSLLPETLQKKYLPLATPVPTVVMIDIPALEPTSFIAQDRSSLIHGRAYVFVDEGIVFLHLYTM